MEEKKHCCCSELTDLVIVGMGEAEGRDERIFATLDLVRDYGTEKWWLYASACNVCGQGWMIAQEERIHDNYCLTRIGPEALAQILEHSVWPDDFFLYEHVLRLGRDAGYIATFLDRRSPALVETAHELRSARPDISVEEIAYVLAIPVKQAALLLRS